MVENIIAGVIAGIIVEFIRDVVTAIKRRTR
jgi:hypothetical protein